MTREESYKKAGRDLYVTHLNGDFNNNLDNLTTICFQCHSEKYFKARKAAIDKIKSTNSLKLLKNIREYNKKCQKGIDFKIIVLLLSGELNERSINRNINSLLNDGSIKQKYGNYVATDCGLDHLID
jgi:cytochrome c553